MTYFPYQLRRMAQQYDTAVTSVMAVWRPTCACDFKDRDLCSDCPEVKIFEQLVRDAIARQQIALRAR